MPQVGNKKFPYTVAGMRAAAKAMKKKVVEKATGEMYPSKAAMKKHEGMETKAMQKMEKKMMPKKKMVKAPVKRRSAKKK